MSPGGRPHCQLSRSHSDLPPLPPKDVPPHLASCILSEIGSDVTKLAWTCDLAEGDLELLLPQLESRVYKKVTTPGSFPLFLLNAKIQPGLSCMLRAYCPH